VLEFAPFFNSKNTPLDIFGHTFFTDWDHDEWTKFYNLMFYCVKEYMEIGIVQVDNSAKLKRKQIKQQFGEDFLDYYDDLESGNFKSITDEWKGFLMKYELDKKEYSLKRFKKGLVIASEVFENEFFEEKNWQHNNIKMFKINKKSNNIDKSLTDNEYLY